MKKIFKYIITDNDVLRENVILPYGAEILSAINQYDKLVLYCLVDPNEDRKEDRTIIIKKTGEEIPQETIDKIKYYHFNFLGTVSLFNGDFILHIWVK